MAVEGDLLSRLERSLASFDDSALAAIASAGMVRRAYKDLERESIKIEKSSKCIRVCVGGEA